MMPGLPLSQPPLGALHLLPGPLGGPSSGHALWAWFVTDWALGLRHWSFKATVDPQRLSPNRCRRIKAKVVAFPMLPKRKPAPAQYCSTALS